MEFTNFNDILKYFGFIQNTTEDCENYQDIDITGGAKNNNCKNFNSDINSGFQDINPMLFVVIGEIIANATSGKLPAAVLNAYGNWLQMIGQVIQAFNAQQQYYQSGPGVYYDPIYRNVNNPFCDNRHKEKKDLKRKHRSRRNSDAEIKKMKMQIDMLVKEINILKNEKR